LPTGCRAAFRRQQQRIALARSLITKPRVLLLDEPLSALDPFLRVRMRKELKRLQRDLGITFVHVTHSQDEAMALADLMVVMDNGHIRQLGSPREVFEHPASSFVARFIGGHNVLPGEGGLTAIRADRCRLGAAGSGPYLSGRVVAVEYQGPLVRVALDTELGGQATALIANKLFYTDPVEPGEWATLVWSGEDTHTLPNT
jgi:putative spermidine/putrescine transport system ATP-binding protein